MNDKGWAAPVGRWFNESVFGKILSVAMALAFGKGVTRERFETRVRLCAKCYYSKGKGIEAHCGICKCNVSAERKFINLARFEETEQYGCHHPEGSVWKKNDV